MVDRHEDEAPDVSNIDHRNGTSIFAFETSVTAIVTATIEENATAT